MTEPSPAPLASSGPVCMLCGGPAVVAWQRRLTVDEITAEQAKEQARRDQVLASADPSQPPPEFGPLPDCEDYTRIVHGCMGHAITKDAASLIHQGVCTAPSEADLPGCNCTPEQPTQYDPDPGTEAPPLPPGW